jgi:ubiquitin conjugation factor E4 B
VSEKGLKLKVKDPERFFFEPRELTVNLLMMYANMSEEDEFVKNVVNDGRSYSDALFKKALALI